jgi:hypothetical protein
MGSPFRLCFNTDRQSALLDSPAAALRWLKIDIRKRRILGLF